MDLRSLPNSKLDELMRLYVLPPAEPVDSALSAEFELRTDLSPATNIADTFTALNTFSSWRIDQGARRYFVEVHKTPVVQYGSAWGLDGFERTACVAMLLAVGVNGDRV